MDESRTTRVTVEEAARLLGIEKQSVKKRVQRGKLRSEKDAGGTTWVYLDGSETVRDKSPDGSGTGRDELLEANDETISLLRDQLRLRAEEIQRRDVIISQLTQATSNLTDRLRELEPPQEAPESPEAPETVEEGPEGAVPQSSTPGPQEAAQPRPWYRRWFGG